MNKAYCRLCALSKSFIELTDIKLDEKVNILKQLARLNCKVEFEDDNLPKTVCFQCQNRLGKAFEFVIGVEQAQSVLNSMVHSHKSSEIEINIDTIKIEELNDEKKHDTSDDEDNVVISSIIEINDTIIVKTSPTTVKMDTHLLKPSTDNSEIKPTWSDYHWKCSRCDALFSTVKELTTHSMENHNICNAYRCIDCKARKTTIEKFVRHIRGHRYNLKFSCYLCLKSFTSSVVTNKHKTSHFTTEFMCKGCQTCFSSFRELDEHTKVYFRHVGARMFPLPKKDSLECHICKKICKSKANYISHLLTHTDRQRDHTCDVCGKSFFHKPHLEEHKAIHSDDKPFQCEICQKSFSLERYLKRHVGVHDDEKPFSCQECGKTSRLEKSLKLHKRIHTDTFPYTCTFCEKRFHSRSNLTQHLRQHTGDKPFKCHICEKEFTNGPNFKKHMKRLHKIMSAKTNTPEYPDNSKLEYKNKILTRRGRGRPKNKMEAV